MEEELALIELVSLYTELRRQLPLFGQLLMTRLCSQCLTAVKPAVIYVCLVKSGARLFLMRESTDTYGNRRSEELGGVSVGWTKVLQSDP